MKTLGKIIVLILLIDAGGFLIWATSGQVPPDGIYVGTITAHAVQIGSAAIQGQ